MPEPAFEGHADVKAMLIYFGAENFISKIDFSNDVNLINVKLKGSTVEGIYFLLKTYLSDTSQSVYLGKTPFQRALVRQWVDFNLLNVIGRTSVSAGVLKELDLALESHSFFAGHALTISDVLFYYSLFPIFNGMTFEQKELYPNLSRWLTLVQEDAQLRQGRPRISFIRVPLYKH